MKVEVKKTSSIQRELSFEIPKDRVTKKLDEVYESISRQAKIKGFRKGKVPRHILEAKHGPAAQQELIEKLIPEAYHEGIHQHELQPVDMPEIMDVNFKDGILTFKAKLDIKPEIKIKDYKEIKVKRKDTKVTNEEINKTLEYFKKGQGGDEKKEVKIDDTFAHGLGYPNLEEFKKSLVKQLELDKDRQNRVDIENQVVEAILKKVKFDVPQSLVNKQLQNRMAETEKRMQQQGMPEEDIAKKRDEMRKELLPVVEKDVMIYLTFDEIAQLENIEVKQGESMPAKVMEFLLKEAKWEG